MIAAQGSEIVPLIQMSPGENVGIRCSKTVFGAAVGRMNVGTYNYGKNLHKFGNMGLLQLWFNKPHPFLHNLQPLLVVFP